MFSFTLQQEYASGARVGELLTRDGIVTTPMFMPVGTRASVKSLDMQDLEALQAQIILANTYHLYLKPSTSVLRQSGGVQNFSGWHGPILTDSGGFQIFSLGAQRLSKGGVSQVTVTENGAIFRSHIDGSEHLFTPTRAIEIQQEIGATIIMSFDELLPDSASASYARTSIDRTLRWANEGHQQWLRAEKKDVYGKYQALFGIVQGGLFQELRQACAETISFACFLVATTKMVLPVWPRE